MQIEHIARLAACHGLVLYDATAAQLDHLELLQELGGQASCAELTAHTSLQPQRRWHSIYQILGRRGLAERIEGKPIRYRLTPAALTLLARTTAGHL
jgi:DNA-binding IclR family transcriptional regulator